MQKIFFFSILFLVLNQIPAFGQNDFLVSQNAVEDTINDNLGLFSSEKILEVSLHFNITEYKKKKPDNEYLDAILTYHTGTNDSISKNIKVRARGVLRRRICEFPPLLLNFRLKDSTGGEFNRIDKLKMVTHCQAGNEKYLLKEYLIYKLYNVLTDNSFKVRLLKVNYYNTFKPGKPDSEFAFVIEPIEFLSERTGSVEVKSTNLNQKNIKQDMMDQMAIFNYMVGNTDWSIPNQHNVVILAQPLSELPDLGMVIPYDFDYSGLVNADYAIPAKELGIESVRNRLYLGICRTEEEFRNALIEFSEKKDAFYKVIANFPYLNEKTKREMTDYLDEFYLSFDKRNSIVYNLLNNCKTF